MSSSPLPLFDYSLEDLYSYISPSTFVDILTCLLLEHQVMLLSKGQLTDRIQSFRGNQFPKFRA